MARASALALAVRRDQRRGPAGPARHRPSHVVANVYNQVAAASPDDLSEVVPLAVESWEVEQGNIAMTMRKA